MKSSYKSLGEYIRQVKVRNRDLGLTEPMGINISKFFMPSVANTNGTDLSKYRIVKNGQFAYNPMHVGRDEVLPIALLKGKNKIIVSPAYVVFEIIDEEVLHPEYLMMWFRRKDFDRNAWFTTDNSVRGGFSWESLCEMELPIPSHEKQQEIVNEYNTVVKRIKLNEELNRKLEDTAQTLYKHWFVDFEFPISKEYSEAIGRTELEGKPYKSNGGEMVYNKELDSEIPVDWTLTSLEELITIRHGFAFKGKFIREEPNENILLSPGNFKIGGGFNIYQRKYYSGKIPEEYIFSSLDLMVTMTDLSKAADTLGYTALIPNNQKLSYLHNQRLGKINFKESGDGKLKFYLFWLMRSPFYRNHIIGGATGTTVKHTSPTRILSFRMPLPKDRNLLLSFNKTAELLHRNVDFKNQEFDYLVGLQDIILSKMSIVSFSQVNLVEQ